MIAYGCYFIYNNQSSKYFDVMMCSIGEELDCPMGIERDVVGTELSVSRPYIRAFTTRYKDVLSFPITLCHNDGSEFTRKQAEDIICWLTSPKTYRLLKIYDDKNDADYTEYMALFTNVESKVVGGRVVGLKFTITCNAPYGYSGECISEVDVTQDTLTFDITNNTTELEEYVFPIVTLIPSSESIKITNITDNNNSVEFKVNGFDEINIDSKNEMIYDSEKNLINLTDLGWNESISETTEQVGDINGDGVVDYNDLVLLRQYVDKAITLSPEQISAADLNGDGKVDVNDVVLLRDILRKPKFPNYMNKHLSIYWLRLLPGQNTIRIDGNCHLKIKFKTPRKVGAI